MINGKSLSWCRKKSKRTIYLGPRKAENNIYNIVYDIIKYNYCYVDRMSVPMLMRPIQ